MFRAGVKTAIRSQIRTRGYSTRAFHANKPIYAGVGLSLIAMPFIYGGIANDAKKISKKSKDEAKQDKVEKSEDIQQDNGKSEEQGQSEKTIEKKDETKVDGNNQTQESKLEGNDDNEPTSEDYEGAAYNPITGEINWDCPCLGGMAHGPCGEEFKEAFACFVYSEAEPKGIDCIKKFEGMRTCFRRYPEHYKEQLEDEEKMEAEYNNENGETVASAESAATPEVSTPTPIEETTVVETSTKSD